MSLLELLETTIDKTFIIEEREAKKETCCGSAGASKVSDQGAQGAALSCSLSTQLGSGNRNRSFP
ncbi:hypothetical protein N7450_006547 [Penicillium hetheringtonii]|uniref:Uncharacterized protein n=1 Tax=Penicillium hetheringtonii TaxID=911720 RepID=A0AAD6DJQ7_9EURO|nr:hypothetical protein N7450_006547 [Penicillium hetheringtonii]